MVTVKNIDGFLSEIAPKNLSQEWDNDGIMLCGNIDKEVKTVLVCLEANSEVISRAKEINAQLIITHHPFIFRPVKNITGETYKEVEELVKSGISVLSYHTRLDVAQGGVNDVLASALELLEVEVCGEFLRVGKLENSMTAQEFSEHIKTKLGAGVMRAYIKDNAVIKRVAVCGGAGKDFLYDAAEIADAYVSADFSHNTFIDAKNLGISVFDAGHYHTENVIVKRISNLLSGKFCDLKIEIYDVGCPFETV